MNGRIIVGMSGGVDSSVAAYLLKREGWEVIGATVRTSIGDDGPVRDAAHVCEQLGIRHVVIDYTDDFERYVIKYFAESYLNGRTPNPCIPCNRYVKWQSLLECMDSYGCDRIATGHYAGVVRLDNGRYTLKTADSQKDQTYVLYRLTQEQLSKTIMPLSGYSKEQVRDIAKSAGLDVCDKPDSMEICFIPDHDYAGFIGRYTGRTLPEGDFVTPEGKVLGRHKGIIHYTVGQRKGLGIALGKPVFVSEIRAGSNEVVLCEGEEVFGNSLIATDINAMAVESLRDERGIEAGAKIRYSNKIMKCVIYPQGDDDIRVVFDENVRAITPGQAAVFYDNEGYVLGGGVIK